MGLNGHSWQVNEVIEVCLWQNISHTYGLGILQREMHQWAED